MWMLSWLACAAVPAVPTDPAVPSPPAPSAAGDVASDVPKDVPASMTYAEALARLADERRSLSARWAEGDRSALADARDTVGDAITGQLFPAWAGTPWDFYGTTETPGEGVIACGYYVSTVLRDAGFRVERAKLAQQPAEWIILTLTPKEDVERFRDRPATEVVGSVRAHGDGLWLVGLDHHVGFLWSEAGRVQMCHASYTGPAVVTCEDAATAEAFASRYRVVGRLLDDPMLEAWLEDRAIPTYTR